MDILSRFCIEGLHGSTTVDVRINDDKLVIVGENGTGKSTVLKLIHFFLTKQWDHMLDFDFNTIYITLGKQNIVIGREELSSTSKITKKRYRSLYGKLPRKVLYELEHNLRQRSINDSSTIDYMMYISDRYDVPFSALETLFEEYYVGDNIDVTFAGKIKEINTILSNLDIGQILYLPTYRRIEQDLNLVFSNGESLIRRNKRAHSTEAPSYIELVEFGMEDVENIIGTTMSAIKDKVRDDLNALTGSYLKDIIRGVHRSDFLLPQLNTTDPAVIEAIFDRIPDTVLGEQDQAHLRTILLRINREQRVPEDDTVIAHFLTQLIDLHNRQTENEKNVKDFVQVCNNYLIGKELVYDDVAFNISILRQVGKEKPQTIAMKTLSSGEKQIVSLFSHLYLSEGSRFYVIIDEPELSLSVKWQRQFLPDILDSSRCSGLLAVTHSPFVFDNELDVYAHSLEEFTAFI